VVGDRPQAPLLAAPADEAAAASSAGRWLALFAVAVILGHHVGTGLEPLGTVGTTRWADWIDLAVPYAVLGCAAGALAVVRPPRSRWALLAVAGILYTQGHGIHLAANSIGNVDPGETAHLWDETVGHYIWYTGLIGVVAALALALATQPASRSAWRLPLALVFGFTIFTNSVEGGTALLGLASGVVFVAWGVRARGRLPELLVPTYAVTVTSLVAWGAYWRGFPQFSDLGWI
jgi:hypothetical protein